jgi:predicted dehydrogenase
MNLINIGVIGYGYWGPNLVRNFMALPDTDVIAVSDARIESLHQVLVNYPQIQVTTKYQELLQNPQIDAIVIATPASTHYDLALAVLQAGKHVLVSKPLATSSEQAYRLIEEADRRDKVLMVDHTFIYTGAVRQIRELILNQQLGNIHYYDSVRINLGLFREDVNVIWDLAVHDLSIMNYVLPDKPIAVSCFGMSHISGSYENISYLTLLFETDLIAHIHVNWLAPLKIRRTLIGGDRQMLVYDDLETREKVKIYDQGITVTNNPENVPKMRVDYHRGNIFTPELDITEALYLEMQHFIECIKNNKLPITDGQSGLQVISLLEAANQSMREEGKLIKLRY